ncbi:UNVERIFIED_CONTAM: hypothetical protein FKN15_040213 [Acipenser sinensis]
MTGEWFDEMKCRRYGENYSVTDVVRSSFKRKRNPGGVTQGNFVTNLEERRRFQIIGEPARTPLLQTINPQSVRLSPQPGSPALCFTPASSASVTLYFPQHGHPNA